MIVNLTDQEQIQSLLGNTFTIVVRYFEMFTSETQERACSMISTLILTHSDLIQSEISTIPSLRAIPLLFKFEKELSKMRSHIDERGEFLGFVQRCEHENVTVVEQALSELDEFLQKQQSFLHLSAIQEQPEPIIAELIRAILDACTRFNESNADIARLSAQCLGLIGCLDPNRVESLREAKEILVLNNFEKADESIDFVIFLLEEILVKAFLSTTNTRSQGFLAYAMQELLRFCRFDAFVAQRSRIDVDLSSTADYRRWIRLPESVRSVLAPFLTSKYVVTAAPIAASTYPIFNPQLSYGTWLRSFVLDLLSKGKGDNAQMVFEICSRIIRDQDIAIANFLLPFAALNVVIGGTEEQRKAIGEELLAVLSLEFSNAGHRESENAKACSEVCSSMFRRWYSANASIDSVSSHRLPVKMDAGQEAAECSSSRGCC
jgi:serine/threonine-protein kinase ATR